MWSTLSLTTVPALSPMAVVVSVVVLIVIGGVAMRRMR